MKRKRKQRMALLEQGVNGIAEMYAVLWDEVAVLKRRLSDVDKERNALYQRLSALEQAQNRLAECNEALAVRLDEAEESARQLALGKTADYWSRGVLDEYMYGADKEDDGWKTT